MRKPRRDERWYRTPGGLIVPRRPTLPTRRFIQKWGTAKCCCDVVACPECCWAVTLSGLDCSALNKTWRVKYANQFGLCVFNCTLPVSCTGCADSVIVSLTIDENGFTVSCDGNSWTLDELPPSDCTPHEYTLVGDVGTCVISPVGLDEGQDCGCGCSEECVICQNEPFGQPSVYLPGTVCGIWTAGTYAGFSVLSFGTTNCSWRLAISSVRYITITIGSFSGYVYVDFRDDTKRIYYRNDNYFTEDKPYPCNADGITDVQLPMVLNSSCGASNPAYVELSFS